MDDTVKHLLRFVARGFYQTPHVLVLDAVMNHSVLSDDDLLFLLEIKKKELRSYCNKLVDDRLLSTHIQKEEHPQQRAVSRTYYYIHITEAIDAIKWKVHSLVNTLKNEMSNYGNPSGYVCKRCNRKVSQLDAISMLSDDKTEFICDVCGGVLVEDDSSQQAQIKQEKLEKLSTQIDPIISYLKKIDDTHVQDNDYEQAMMKRVPAQPQANQGNYGGRSRKNISSSLAQDASRAQATLQVSITANDKDYEREQEEKEERRLKLEQNALPSWHSESTVGQSSLGKFTEDEPMVVPAVDVKPVLKVEEDEEVDVKPVDEVPQQSNSEIKDKEAQDALAAYYAELAQRNAEEDEDDDEDDDDDFDDLL